MPGRSALTVTPCTAATVPIALMRRRPLFALRDDRRHRLGRRLHRGELRRHGLELPELHEAKAAMKTTITTTIRIIRFAMFFLCCSESHFARCRSAWNHRLQ